MANNKVQLADGTTLIDLTADTVTPQTLVAPATAHSSNGEQITGVVNLANASTVLPTDIRAASIGSATEYARADHSHKGAPYEHASSGTGHGKGTGTYYGHVKLSSAIDDTSGESDGVAATPSAVKAVADATGMAVATLLGSTYATNVKSGGTIPLSSDPTQYAFLYIVFGSQSTLSGSTRGGVLVTAFSATAAEYYPAVIGGTSGNVRLSFSNSPALSIASSSFSSLYVHRVFGMRKKQDLTIR